MDTNNNSNSTAFDPTSIGAKPYTPGAFDPTSIGAKPFTPDMPKQDINNAAAVLGQSNSWLGANGRLPDGSLPSDTMDALKASDQQSKAAADKSQSPLGIVTNALPDVGPNGPTTVGQSVGDTFNSVGKFIKSAVRSPVDIIRGMFGLDPYTTDQEKADPSQQTFQSQFKGTADALVNDTSPKKKIGNLGDSDILGNTAGTFADVVGSGSMLLGGEVPFKGALEKIPGAKAAVNAASDALGNKAANSSVQEAKAILNPSGKYTPTESEQLRNTGQVKTKGIGLFKKDVASPATTPQHEALGELVDQGKIASSNTPQQNISAISQEAHRYDSNIDELVNRPELNKPFQTATLDKVIGDVKSAAKKNLTFVSDSTEEKAYNDVLGVYRDEITSRPQNSSGLRAGIKAANARMENILGKDIYGGPNESVGNARIQATKDARTSLNNFLSDNLQSSQTAKAVRNVTSTGTKDLIASAKKFPNPDDFIRNSGDELKGRYLEETNRPEYRRILKNVRKGMSLDDAIAKEGVGINFNNDLREIWQTAHTDIKGTGGNLYKSQLQREAQLLNAKDEIAYKTRGSLGKSQVGQTIGKFVGKHPVISTAIGGALTGGAYEGAKKTAEKALGM